MSGGGKGGGSQVIGYRYLMSLHMGLCRGPVDELLHIRVGDKSAWAGTATGRQDISIDAYDLFGGDKREGGIKGTFKLLPGNSIQEVLPELNGLSGGLAPAFRGVVTAFFDGIICAMNPYPKEWKMRVRRTINGWDSETPWYPEKATIWMRNNHVDVNGETPDEGARENLRKIRAMNPAHILYELATNRDWSRGLPAELLDLDSYRAAADILYNEGFGLCVKWTRSDSVTALAQMIIDHIGGALYVDRSTGLLTLKLIRDNYDVNSLPTFTPTSGLLDIQDDESSTADSGYNEVQVTWHDPVTDKDGQVREQNLGAIQAQGAINSVQRQYLSIPTTELARRVALRDLKVTASGLKRYKVKLDRAGRKLAPASVFRISDPARGMNNLILRVGSYEDGNMTDGSVTITAMQDVFGLPFTSLTAEQPNNWIPPDVSARPVTDAALVETTFRGLVKAIGVSDASAKTTDACYLAALAKAPSRLSLGYDLMARPDGAADFTKTGSGGWCPSAILSTALTASVSSTSASLTDFSDGVETIKTGGAVLIGDEIVRIDYLNTETGGVTFARGCVDTLPQAHAAGVRVWFIDEGAVADATEYLPFEAVDAKLLTRTSSQVLSADAAPVIGTTTMRRQGRPYPPANVRINGAEYFNMFPQNTNITLTWAHRDRIGQQDQCVEFSASNIGPEPGVTYTVVVTDPANNVVRTVTGITGTSWSYTAAMRSADGIIDEYSLTLKSVRGGIENLYPIKTRTVRSPAGLGLRLGLNLGGISV